MSRPSGKEDSEEPDQVWSKRDLCHSLGSDPIVLLSYRWASLCEREEVTFVWNISLQRANYRVRNRAWDAHFLMVWGMDLRDLNMLTALTSVR